MNINEVLKKLGLSSEKEIIDIEQLKQYQLTYIEPNNKKQGNYFEVNDRYSTLQKSLILDYISILEHDQPIMPIFFYRKIVGWHALLNLNRKSETSKYEPPFLKISDNNRSDLDQAINYVGSYESQIFDGGHLLGKFTKKYFDFPLFYGNHNRKKVRNRNIWNEYPQFKRANENTTNDVGQLRFEQEITKDKDNSIFYYEIEAIFREEYDQIPIGNRIRIEKYSKDKKQLLKQLSHTFIPNCDYAENTNKSTILKENTIENYRDFFRTGNIGYLKKKNIYN
ncbi:hypothetical protein [Lactobacillus sp. PSON]|uniref:hypothetical protein n=1 Tax=Lactobacillus sp. PSON TaxID=3455454 RepID=UPI004042C70E